MAEHEKNDDVDSDDGNMLNDLDKGELDFDKEDNEPENEDDKLFGLNNSNDVYN